MFNLRLVFTFLTLSISFVLAQQPYNPPPTIPLAVRSPYLNSHFTPWNSADQWPKHWNALHINGWDLRIMVDGENLQLFGGRRGTLTNRTNIEITPTRSILTIQARTMDVTVTFLSPIEPNDLVLQSFPFVYMYVDVKSNDGQEHSVQLYSDVTGEWLSGDTSSEIKWSTVKTDSLLYHRASRSSPSMDEISDIAEDATLYFAFPNGDDVTYRTGASTPAREQWANNKTLNNDESTQYSTIKQSWPSFSFARDLGTISATQDSVMWAFGLVRDPSIKYMSQERHPYFWTRYSDISDAISDFVSDFNDARGRAVAFDQTLQDEARTISDDYVDIISMAARQTLAGTEITVGKSEGGDWNTSDIMTFMRDIGVARRASPVPIIYTSFPAFLKINATWAGYLLTPLLAAQNYENGPSYAISDLGSKYPTATANLSPSPKNAVDSTSDMLIMVWAHATFSGDASLVKAYYGLLKKWANYLVDQRTDMGSFTDQDNLSNTNLALKSVLGIKCMAAIANAVEKSDDSTTFTAKAASIYDEWKSKAIMDDHIVSNYDESTSWGLIYNVFYDRLLGLEVIDDTIISQQDSFYKSKFESEGGQFGIQYDSSRPGQSISTWSMFTAATTLDNDVRDKLISGVHNRATFNGSSSVFPTGYSPKDGTTLFGQASAAQGAVFSFLALNLQRNVPQGGGAIQESSNGLAPDPNTNSNAGSGSGSDSGAGSGPGQNAPHAKSPIAPAAIGGAIGGLALMALATIAFLLYRRQNQRRRHSGIMIRDMPDSPPSARTGLTAKWHYSIEPFIQRTPTQHLFSPVFSDEKSRMYSPQSASLISPYNGNWSPKSRGKEFPEGLVTDVENLRRELDQMREQTMCVAPPQYVNDEPAPRF